MKTRLSQPLLHSATEREINHWLVRPSHGLLLGGASNHNQNEVAAWLASQLDAANVYSIETGSSIGIDDIRDVVKLAKQKKDRSERVVFVLPDAEKLTDEAQNALLKILEEPAAGTFFILASANAPELLGTVLSRLYFIEVKPLSKQAYDASHTHLSRDELSRHWSLSRGHVSARQLDEAVLAQAKQFVTATKYERLKMAASLAKNKESLVGLLAALTPIYSHLLHRAVSGGKPAAQVNQLIDKQNDILKAEHLLSQNVNPKAILAYLSSRL